MFNFFHPILSSKTILDSPAYSRPVFVTCSWCSTQPTLDVCKFDSLFTLWLSFYKKVSSVQVFPLQCYSISFSSRTYLNCLPKSCDPLSFSTTVIPTVFLTSTYLPACLFYSNKKSLLFNRWRPTQKAALATKTTDISKIIKNKKIRKYKKFMCVSNGSWQCYLVDFYSCWPFQ